MWRYEESNLPTEAIRTIEDRLFDAMLDGRITVSEYNAVMMELNGEEMYECLNQE